MPELKGNDCSEAESFEVERNTRRTKSGSHQRRRPVIRGTRRTVSYPQPSPHGKRSEKKLRSTRSKERGSGLPKHHVNALPHQCDVSESSSKMLDDGAQSRKPHNGLKCNLSKPSVSSPSLESGSDNERHHYLPKLLRSDQNPSVYANAHETSSSNEDHSHGYIDFLSVFDSDYEKAASIRDSFTARRHVPDGSSVEEKKDEEVMSSHGSQTDIEDESLTGFSCTQTTEVSKSPTRGTSRSDSKGKGASVVRRPRTTVRPKQVKRNHSDTSDSRRSRPSLQLTSSHGIETDREDESLTGSCNQSIGASKSSKRGTQRSASNGMGATVVRRSRTTVRPKQVKRNHSESSNSRKSHPVDQLTPSGRKKASNRSQPKQTGDESRSKKNRDHKSKGRDNPPTKPQQQKDSQKHVSEEPKKDAADEVKPQKQETDKEESHQSQPACEVGSNDADVSASKLRRPSNPSLSNVDHFVIGNRNGDESFSESSDGVKEVITRQTFLPKIGGKIISRFTRISKRNQVIAVEA